MTENIKLYREILAAVEAIPYGESLSDGELRFEDYSKEEIAYHVELLFEQGLIFGEHYHNIAGGYQFDIKRLTSKGHAFLEALRDNEGFNKIMKYLAGAGKFAAETVLKAAFDYVVRGMIS